MPLASYLSHGLLFKWHPALGLRLPPSAALAQGGNDPDAAFAFLVGHVCYAVIFTVESLGSRAYSQITPIVRFLNQRTPCCSHTALWCPPLAHPPTPAPPRHQPPIVRFLCEPKRWNQCTPCCSHTAPPHLPPLPASLAHPPHASPPRHQPNQTNWCIPSHPAPPPNQTSC